jgi:hypothetical protein
MQHPMRMSSGRGEKVRQRHLFPKRRFCKKMLVAEGSNAPPMSAMPVATPDADEGSALESSAASPFPQYAKPVIGKSAEPAEEIGKTYARPKSDDQSSDTAESAVEHIAFGHESNITSVGPLAVTPTGETVAVLMFGMALAGLLFGVVSIMLESEISVSPIAASQT